MVVGMYPAGPQRATADRRGLLGDLSQWPLLWLANGCRREVVFFFVRSHEVLQCIMVEFVSF
jgi:hypothetical protein